MRQLTRRLDQHFNGLTVANGQIWIWHVNLNAEGAGQIVGRAGQELHRAHDIPT